MFRLLFISVIFYIFPLIQAIEVESNSPCHSTCGAPSTPAGALTCQDNGYNTTNDGRKMQACLECESTSTISNPSNGNDTGKADLYWFMFNMKYTLEFCLFQQDRPGNSTVPACFEPCNPLAPILLDGWHTPPAYKPLYDYCTDHNNVFPDNVGKCVSCLKSQPGSGILGNFLDTMRTACDSKPNATDGQTLKVPGNGLFSLDTSTASTDPPANTTSPSSSSSPSPSDSSSGLSSGASAGIGVGVAVAVLAVLAAVAIWFWRRRRHQKRDNAREQIAHNLNSASWERKELPAEDKTRPYSGTDTYRTVQSPGAISEAGDTGTYRTVQDAGTYSEAGDTGTVISSQAKTTSTGGTYDGRSVSVEAGSQTPMAELEGSSRNSRF